MASFKLIRFISPPEILRGIDPKNLLSLLVDHKAALDAMGCKLPAELREAFYLIH